MTHHEHIISVVVSIYNARVFLDKCIRSILSQTYESLEIILVNDGSTDDSLSICNRYMGEDSRIRVFSQENSGPSKAKNTGIDLATGYYLLFVDSDDFLEPDMIRHMHGQIDAFDGELAICGYRRISSSQQNPRTEFVYVENKIFLYGIPLPDFVILYRKLLLNQNWNKLYRTDIIRNHSISFINSLSLGEDLLFNLIYLRHCNKVTVLDSCHYNFVYGNTNSLSNKYRQDLFTIQQSIYEAVMGYIIEQYPLRDSDSLDILERCHAITVASCIATICKTRNVNRKEKYEDIYRLVRNPAVLKIMKAQKGQGFKNKVLYRLISMKQVFLLMLIFQD